MMQFDPGRANDWVQLVVINGLVFVSAIGGLWHWLIAPLRKQIKSECEARKAEVATEREARKAADAHRDERVREARDAMQAAVGRVEMLERKAERSDDDRSSMRNDLADLTSRQESQRATLENARLAYERSMGEIRTSMADMKTELERSIRAAIAEAATMNRRNQ